jgi:hypothetical protein
VPDVKIIRAHLPLRLRPGCYWPKPERAYILVHDELHPLHERAVVEHEMAHHRRGGGVDRPWMPALWRSRVARDEMECNREAADRLVPVDELAVFCDRMASLGEGVGPDEVMTEFDCTRRVAEDALDNLTRHERGLNVQPQGR